MYIDLLKVQQYKILEETPSNSTTNNEIELLKRLSDLSLNEQTDNETIVHETLISTNNAKQLEAKLKELSQWEQGLVYEEIDDKGQERISLRWVLKEKINDNGSKFIKAHLCATGFEEMKFQNRQPDIFQRRTLHSLLLYILKSLDPQIVKY